MFYTVFSVFKLILKLNLQTHDPIAKYNSIHKTGNCFDNTDILPNSISMSKYM